MNIDLSLIMYQLQICDKYFDGKAKYKIKLVNVPGTKNSNSINLTDDTIEILKSLYTYLL